MTTTLRRIALVLGAAGLVALSTTSPARAAITVTITSTDGGGPLVYSAPLDAPPTVTLTPTAGGPISVGSFTLNNFSLTERLSPPIGPPFTEGIASQQQTSLERGSSGGVTEILTITATYTIDPGEVFLPGSPIQAFATLSSDTMFGDWTVTHTGTVEGVGYTPLGLTGPIPPVQPSLSTPTIIAPRSGAITIVQTITVAMGYGDSGDFQASTVVGVVPEPSTLVGFALGVPILGLLALRRLRSRRP